VDHHSLLKKAANVKESLHASRLPLVQMWCSCGADGVESMEKMDYLDKCSAIGGQSGRLPPICTGKMPFGAPSNLEVQGSNPCGGAKIWFRIWGSGFDPP